MKENVTTQKTLDFAVRIVNCVKFLNSQKKEYIISKQMMQSGTSIGANIAEAYGAFSKSDFAYKVSISYKECQETKFWLKLLQRTDYISEQIYKSMMADAEELSKMLYAILNKVHIKK